MNSENQKDFNNNDELQNEVLNSENTLLQNDNNTPENGYSEETINDYLAKFQENNNIIKEKVNTTYKTKTTDKVIEKTSYDNKNNQNKYSIPPQTNINYYYDGENETNKKNKHSFLSFLFIIMIIGVLGTCFYMIYKVSETDKKPNNSELSDTPDKIINDNTDTQKELDLNDTTVQILYNYVKTSNEEDVLLENALLQDDGVFASGLPSSVKNYLGYRLLYDSEIEMIKCSNLEDDMIDGIECSTDNKESTTTKFISDDKLKTKVELIFGPNNFMFDTFSVDSTSEYKHSDLMKGFVFQTKKIDDSNKDKRRNLTKKLVKAIKKIDTIELYEEQKDEQAGINRIVNYTFLLQDNMYYFYTIRETK